MNCAPAYVRPQDLHDLPVTIIDVWDDSALTSQVKEQVYKCYPAAKMGHLKTGGNFPFLSRSEEVNLHLLVRGRESSRGDAVRRPLSDEHFSHALVFLSLFPS